MNVLWRVLADSSGHLNVGWTGNPLEICLVIVVIKGCFELDWESLRSLGCSSDMFNGGVMIEVEHSTYFRAMPKGS